MAQHRKAPAFQEYAAAMLANKEFRLMSFAERGLLFTLRLECWENIDLPASEENLAKYLGCDLRELNAVLTNNVKSYFEVNNGLLSCPELDDYRRHLDERKTKQSEGGKKGAAKVNKKFKEYENLANTCDKSTTVNPQVPRRGSHESLVQHSILKQSQKQSLKNHVIATNQNDKWVEEYENASNGG